MHTQRHAALPTLDEQDLGCQGVMRKTLIQETFHVSQPPPAADDHP